MIPELIPVILLVVIMIWLFISFILFQFWSVEMTRQCFELSPDAINGMLIAAIVWPISLPIYLGIRVGHWLAGEKWT